MERVVASRAHVGQRIRELRTRRGLSQEQLAGPGVSASYISLIESGHRQPSRSALDSIAAALGTTTEFLEHGEAAASRRRAELSLRHAQLLLSTGAAAEAEAQFRALLGADVELHVRRPAQQGLAAALEHQGALEQAIAVYEEMRTQAEVSHDADWVSATIALVRCYREAGDLGRSADLGERMLDRLASLGLPRTELHLQLAASVAFTAYERGDLVRARQLIEEVLAQAVALDSRRAQ